MTEDAQHYLGHPLLHPETGDPSFRSDLMARLGSGPVTVRPGASLRFTARDRDAAYDIIGANCGPAALAAAIGSTPLDTARLIPGFAERRYTTEVMMALALGALGVRFRWVPVDNNPAPRPTFALVRVTFGEGGVLERLRRSHWVLHRGGPDMAEVFDVNAMGIGGWVSLKAWDEAMGPWLADRFYDGARPIRDFEYFDLTRGPGCPS